MQKTQLKAIALLGMAGLALAGAATACADEKIVQKIVIQNPQLQAALKNLSPQQRAQMAKMGLNDTMSTTTYSSGQNLRTDIGLTTVMSNPAARIITTLNRDSRTYTTTPYPSQVNFRERVNAKIVPTGQTRTILGHAARHYRISLSGPDIAHGYVTGDVWVARDLTLPTVPNNGTGISAVIQRQVHKIPGLPLDMTLVIHGEKGAQTKIHAVVQSISTTRLPNSTFAVPKGFVPGPAGLPTPNALPGAG